MKQETVELGDLAKDMVSGYQGVCVSFAKCLTGCDRVILQAQVGSDAKLPDSYSFDVTTVEVVQKGYVKPIGRDLPETPVAERKRGGPPTRAHRY
jgi:hypothetical protein